MRAIVLLSRIKVHAIFNHNAAGLVVVMAHARVKTMCMKLIAAFNQVALLVNPMINVFGLVSTALALAISERLRGECLGDLHSH